MMDKSASVRMRINGIELSVSMVVYDNCHKIYAPVEGQEEIFIKSMEEKGWIWDEDFYKIESLQELCDMYLNSCSLRFIEQIDCSGGEDKFITIIPQCAFNNEDGFFDEDAARKAFVSL
jgi:hypothetical protein